MIVKICGITNTQDALLALSLGAGELGFVLAPSPRRVPPEAVKAIVGELRSRAEVPAFRAIGVFVNEKPNAMRDIMAFAGLDAAQIHGDESPEDCAAFDFPWYRALRIGSVAEAERLLSLPWTCSRILVDKASGASYGGTGSSIGTWAALAARELTKERGKEFFVAGGVKPRSVASFMRSIAPDGLDVSSGVEEAPGRKSERKLRELFAQIAQAEELKE